MEAILLFVFIPAIFKLFRFVLGVACHIIAWVLNLFSAILDGIATNRAKANRQKQIEAVRAERRAIQSAKEQAKQERMEAARVRQGEQEQHRQQLHELKREQARQDVIFYTETRRDIMKLYAAAEAEYKAAATDRAKETALRRMLSYDAKLRAVDKRREAAALVAAI